MVDGAIIYDMVSRLIDSIQSVGVPFDHYGAGLFENLDACQAILFVVLVIGVAVATQVLDSSPGRCLPSLIEVQ